MPVVPAVVCGVPAPEPSSNVTRQSTFHLGYRPELDGVRGISILLVLGLHFIPRFMPGGYLGVEIFFVLSGFLITSLLLQEWERRNSISLKDFYLRRGLLLVPPLLLYLLLLSGYAIVFMKARTRRKSIPACFWTPVHVSNCAGAEA